MSKAITSGQARSLIGSFTVDTPWDEIVADIQPFIELSPVERGKRFADFVRNGCRLMIGSQVIKIDRTKLFNPTDFIGAGWMIDEPQDEKSLALNELDLAKVRFETMLKAIGESSVAGEEKLKRLKEANHTRLDARIFQILWENQQLIPESWKEKINGNTRYIFFDGTILGSRVAAATSCACAGMAVSGTATTSAGSAAVSMPAICLLFLQVSSLD